MSCKKCHSDCVVKGKNYHTSGRVTYLCSICSGVFDKLPSYMLLSFLEYGSTDLPEVYNWISPIDRNIIAAREKRNRPIVDK